MREGKFTKLTTIALPQTTFEKVKAIADARKISNSEWFREAVNEKLQKDDSGIELETP